MHAAAHEEWEEVPPAKGSMTADDVDKEDEEITEMCSDHNQDASDANKDDDLEDSKPAAIEETTMINATEEEHDDEGEEIESLNDNDLIVQHPLPAIQGTVPDSL